jgi:hypothetical protein
MKKRSIVFGALLLVMASGLQAKSRAELSIALVDAAKQVKDNVLTTGVDLVQQKLAQLQLLGALEGALFSISSKYEGDLDLGTAGSFLLYDINGEISNALTKFRKSYNAQAFINDLKVIEDGLIRNVDRIRSKNMTGNKNEAKGVMLSVEIVLKDVINSLRKKVS